MNILFIGVPDVADPFSDEWFPDLRYAISFLRKKGAEAGLRYSSMYASEARMLVKIAELSPGLAFFKINGENQARAIGLAGRIKAANRRIKIVLGGIAATASYKAILSNNPSIDYVIVGEWELTLLEMVEKMRAGRKLTKVPGLVTRERENQARPLIENIDIFSDMALDGVDKLLHGKSGMERAGYLIGSRGCYGNCSFCSVPPFYRVSRGRAWRGRSSAKIVDEIEKMVNAYGIKYFVFLDDNFIGPGRSGKARARKFAEEIIRRKIKIRYFVCSRVNDIDYDVLKVMKRSGLDVIGIGIESTSQRALDLFHKNIQVENIYRLLDQLEKRKIKTEVNMVFFDPYMTLAEVRQNLKFIKYINKTKYISYSQAFPFNELKVYPWTPLREKLRLDKLLDEKRLLFHYKDPRVKQIINLLRYFRRHPAINFKNRLLFKNLNKLIYIKNNRGLVLFLSKITDQLRRRLTFELLPVLIEEACDVLEANEINQRDKMNKIRIRAQKEAKKIGVMGDKIYSALLRSKADS